jgi:hypothetical protein
LRAVFNPGFYKHVSWKDGRTLNGALISQLFRESPQQIAWNGVFLERQHNLVLGTEFVDVTISSALPNGESLVESVRGCKKDIPQSQRQHGHFFPICICPLGIV